MVSVRYTHTQSDSTVPQVVINNNMNHLVFALVLLLIVAISDAFHRAPLASRKSTSLNGIMDALNKAMANENLPPPKSAGLSREPEPVEVEFLPSGKKTKALLGQKFKVIAQQAKVQIPYSCERGDCGTCSVKFNGKIVKACQVSLPAASKEKKFTIEVNTSISFPTYPLLIVNSRNAFLYVVGVEERFLFYKTNEGLNLLVVHCTHDSFLFSMS